MRVAAPGAEEEVKAPKLPDTDQDYYIWASQIIAALMSNEQILMSILSLLGKILSVIWTVNSSGEYMNNMVRLSSVIARWIAKKK